MTHERAQVAWLDMIAGAMLFTAFLAEAAYVLHQGSSGLATYASETAAAISSNASMQEASYALGLNNASATQLEAAGVVAGRFSPGPYASYSPHAYNGSRLAVLNGTVYVIKGANGG